MDRKQKQRYETTEELALALLARLRADKFMGRRGSWPAEAEALCVHITGRASSTLPDPTP